MSITIKQHPDIVVEYRAEQMGPNVRFQAGRHEMCDITISDGSRLEIQLSLDEAEEYFTKCLAGIREARQVIAFDVLAHPEPDAVSK